jgi:flagellar protein FliO/FliZ
MKTLSVASTVPMMTMGWCQTAGASAPASAPGPLAAMPMGTFLAELVLVGLLAVAGWAIVWATRRRMQRGSAGVGLVRVVSATSLGARERAVVIEAKGRLLLVGVTPQQVSYIADLGHSGDASATMGTTTAADT